MTKTYYSWRRPYLYGDDPRYEPREQRDLLFTVVEAKTHGIYLYGRPVAFEWDYTDYDKPRRRGLYMGRPFCPGHLKYVKWWAHNELATFDDNLADLHPDDEKTERYLRARKEMAKRLLWQADAGWVDIYFYEIEPDVQDGYIHDMWLLHPERLQRQRGRD